MSENRYEAKEKNNLIKNLVSELNKYDENLDILFYCSCCAHTDFEINQEGVDDGTICINIYN